MFRLIKQVFIVLLTFSGSLNSQECTTQPNLINLHPNEYIQG